MCFFKLAVTFISKGNLRILKRNSVFIVVHNLQLDIRNSKKEYEPPNKTQNQFCIVLLSLHKKLT
jgi:hypothetical protein